MQLARTLPAILTTALLVTSAGAQTSDGILLSEAGDSPSVATAGSFHCQTSLYGSANASTGYGSEMADDIPASLAGLSIQRVTLLVAEWLAPWIQPDGIEIRFYAGACPPSLAPSSVFLFTWEELSGFRRNDIDPPFTVYEMTALLPSAVEIVPPMSIGAIVKNSWGTSTPSCGFMFGRANAIAGCDGFYWHLPPQVPHWSAMSFGDLWMCLGSDATGVPLGDESAPQAAQETSWGGIKRLYR